MEITSTAMKEDFFQRYKTEYTGGSLLALKLEPKLLENNLKTAIVIK